MSAEGEFALGLGRIDEAGARMWRLHSPSTNSREVPVETDRVEDVVARVPVFVAASLEVFETGDRFRVDLRLGREACHHGEWSAGVGTGFRHMTGALNLVDSPVEHDHLAIEIGESAKTEIAMLQDGFDTDFSVINARNQGARGRDLEQRMNRHAEVLGQGGGNNRRKCPFGPGDLSVQRCLERGWNGGIEICHRSSPTGLN